MMHGWDSESVFLIYEIIYEKRRLFPFLDQNHERISLYSLNKAFFSISGPKAWKYFFIFMKQGWESESISLYLWNKVEKVKVFLYIYETRFRKQNNFLYFHEKRLVNEMNRRRLATLSGEISAWSFIQHHLTSTLTWYTRRPKKTTNKKKIPNKKWVLWGQVFP